MTDDDDTEETTTDTTTDHEPVFRCTLLAEFEHPTSRNGVVTRMGTPYLVWVTDDVEHEPWKAWTMAGLSLFAGELPSLRTVTTAAKKVLISAANDRFGGNITQMAKAVGTSRRALRDFLKATGTYAPPSYATRSIPPSTPNAEEGE